ncbi:MAG: DUF3536 domain-containing protein [Candidatus Magnetoovum sp. WYHC-5]|nr:DUF3536 domain-containing protein [Candidatus Magnetoovum sp. WYHC-5]
MNKYICIHGHFYQPPRENPWLEEVELQDSAYPYHDWNERITAECYAPHTVSRILGQDGNIIDMVSNYSKISFNFGPTLLSWFERHSRQTHDKIVEADKLSMQRFSGHGSAIAQVYNHIIMPLASTRDKYTQVKWGIADFQKRFNRAPEGMWLAETAVNLDTLEVLADHNIKFTILAPRQASRVRKLPQAYTNELNNNNEYNNEWQDVSDGRIDPSTTYLCNLPSGKTITLFFYDGPISQGIAFDGMLKSGEAFAKRLIGAFNDERQQAQLVHIANDGETYGHHHHKGDMALAYCLYLIEQADDITLTNYGEFLEKHPPVYEVEIFDNSSWSCIHGVGRWMENCGCHTGMHHDWHQHWRAPLRMALDWLRDSMTPFYEAELSNLSIDPWQARDAYIDVILDRSEESINAFFEKYAKRQLNKDEKTRAIKLLELQRNAMLMYTSCAWFFDEISGIETVQVMNYAARVIQYHEELTGFSVEEQFLEKLQTAPSNLFENGAKVYDMFVRPSKLDMFRVGAHYAISSLFEQYKEESTIFCFSFKRQDYTYKEAGKIKLAIGIAKITSNITKEEKDIMFAVFHLGDHNINCGIINCPHYEHFVYVKMELEYAFEHGHIPKVIELISIHFGNHPYTLWHLFKDEQRKALDMTLETTYEYINSSYKQIYDNNYPIMSFLKGLNIPIPEAISTACSYTVKKELVDTLKAKVLDIERLQKVVKEVQRWNIDIDRAQVNFISVSLIDYLMESLQKQSDYIDLFYKIIQTIELLKTISIEPNLWHAQNIFYSLRKHKDNIWIEAFNKLGECLGVKTKD